MYRLEDLPPSLQAYVETAAAQVPSKGRQQAIRDELADHLCERWAELLARDCSPEQAEQLLLAEMGDVEPVGQLLGSLHSFNPLEATHSALGNLAWSLVLSVFSLNFIANLYGGWPLLRSALIVTLLLMATTRLRQANKRLRWAFYASLLQGAWVVISCCLAALPLELAPQLMQYFSVGLQAMVYYLLFYGLRDLTPAADDKPGVDLCFWFYLVSMVVGIWLPVTPLVWVALILMLLMPVMVVRYDGYLYSHQIDTPSQPINRRGKAALLSFGLVCAFLPLAFLWQGATAAPAAEIWQQADVSRDDPLVLAQVEQITDNLRELGMPEIVLASLPQSELLHYADVVELQIEFGDHRWHLNDELAWPPACSIYALRAAAQEDTRISARLLVFFNCPQDGKHFIDALYLHHYDGLTGVEAINSAILYQTDGLTYRQPLVGEKVLGFGHEREDGKQTIHGNIIEFPLLAAAEQQRGYLALDCDFPRGGGVSHTAQYYHRQKWLVYPAQSYTAALSDYHRQDFFDRMFSDSRSPADYSEVRWLHNSAYVPVEDSRPQEGEVVGLSSDV